MRTAGGPSQGAGDGHGGAGQEVRRAGQEVRRAGPRVSALARVVVGGRGLREAGEQRGAPGEGAHAGGATLLLTAPQHRLRRPLIKKKEMSQLNPLLTALTF